MDDREARLNQVAQIAVPLEAQTGCPAALMITVWALESDWGEKPVGHANYFGIKRAARHTKCVTVTTHEVINGVRVVKSLEFADYDSLEDSCKDFAWLITQGEPYQAAWRQYQQDRDLRALISAVSRVYATDPHYTALAEEISEQSNVAQAIAQAL